MIQKILVAFLATVFIFGCSKAPKEYSKNEVVDNSRPHQQDEESEAEMFKSLFTKAQELSSADGSVSTSDLLDFDPSSFQPGGEEFDKKVKLNANQPMIYAAGGTGGAAGISFTTTYEESRQIAIPRTPPNINGDAVYDENMVIRWRTTEPKTPVFFQMFSGYTGDVQVPAPFAPFKLKHDFSNQYAANTEAGARKMARDFYNMFEAKDQSFDCLSVGYCIVDWGAPSQKNFVIVLPGMQLLLSKDRFVVFVVRIVKVVPQGPLASDLDIIDGKFVIGEEFADLKGQTIGLGETAEMIDAKLNISTETSAGTDTFGRNYNGVFLGYHRTKYEREDLLPLPTDKLKMIQVYRDYKRNLTIGGMPVIVRETADNIEIEVATTPDFVGSETETVREVPFAISIGLQRNNVRKFAEKARDFLAAEFGKAFPKATVVSHLTGTQQKKDIKSYDVLVIVYDRSSKQGKFVQMSIGEEDGHLQSFLIINVGESFNAVDPLILEDILAPVQKAKVVRYLKDGCGETQMNVVQGPNGEMMNESAIEVLDGNVFNSISGFTVGEVVRVENWDLGRSQADITYERGEQQFKVRGDYVDRGIQNVAFDVTEKVKPQDQSFVDIGSLSISLGLKLTCETQKQRVYKIVTVSSAMKLGEVKDLCGPLALSFKVGTPASELLGKLQSTQCAYKPIYDSGGNGRLVNVYLPNDRIRLNFGDLELSGVTMYTPVNEVQ